MKCSNCEKELTTKMEVEYSAWLTEYFCSSKCATNRYFNYMESTPVDFENLPDSLVIVGDKLEAVEHSVHSDEGDSSDEEEFTNPYLLSGEELERTIALRR